MNTRQVLIGVLLLAACRGKGDDSVQRAERPATFGLGRAATASEIAAIDIDANSAGAGLPTGQGTADAGATVYAQKCASCHGAKGEGIEKNPKLIGREPAAGFVFASDAKVPKTIGNYWPYATTLYDYIHRTMPLNAPGSLTSDEIYGLVAFLLRENGIPTAPTLDAKTLAAVKMPAQSRFVKDNRTGGATFR
jgi:S-disulfanyl-L-cysteine oxidoreductase SoxD